MIDEMDVEILTLRGRVFIALKDVLRIRDQSFWNGQESVRLTPSKIDRAVDDAWERNR